MVQRAGVFPINYWRVTILFLWMMASPAITKKCANTVVPTRVARCTGVKKLLPSTGNLVMFKLIESAEV